MSGLLGGFSPHLPWSRRRWWAARLILAALVVWLVGSFWGERLEHGPRRKGGAS